MDKNRGDFAAERIYLVELLKETEEEEKEVGKGVPE
jgi:hypothetical protein